jgi:multidrug efflux pump subunit AcrA (membrane-fusion protein)
MAGENFERRHEPGQESLFAAASGQAQPRGWPSLWLGLRTIQARLRFVALLAAVGGVLVYWDTLKAHYEKWTRPLSGKETAAAPDIEYWCPMHPTVIRDHPDNCPICGMPLSKRIKGTSSNEALQPGVISRLALSPYQVRVAGIESAAIGYQALSREISAAGFVEFDERRLARISWRVSGRENRIDRLHANVTGATVHKGDSLALVYSPELASTVTNLLDARRGGNRDLESLSRQRLELWGIDDAQVQEIVQSGKPVSRLTIRSPINGHVIKKYAVEGDYLEAGNRLYDVADLSTVWIEAQFYEEDIPFVKVGLPVTARAKAFPNKQFQGTISFIHPHLDASTRTLRVRFDVDNPDHELRPGMYATILLQVPATELESVPSAASADQKRSHDKGLMLAVPEQAVIDTGSRKLVYRESAANVFEGIEVQLGPRCGSFYPILQGLRAGDRVATSGSFLIDAETRLTAGAGSTYFGAGGGPAETRPVATARSAMVREEEDKIAQHLARLGSGDEALARAQGRCPITNRRLGSMGVPDKILIQGQAIFLCCPGCEEESLTHPGETLSKLKQRQAGR